MSKNPVAKQVRTPKFKSLSVKKEDWEQLGVLATKTNRTRSTMIGRLIRFFLDNKGAKANGKSKT